MIRADSGLAKAVEEAARAALDKSPDVLLDADDDGLGSMEEDGEGEGVLGGSDDEDGGAPLDGAPGAGNGRFEG